MTTDWTISAVADFDSNGAPDLLWSQAGTGRRLIWLMLGTARLNSPSVELGTVSTDWSIGTAADFDGNGTPDIVWSQASTGRRLIWLMQGAARLNNQNIELGTVSVDWSISAAADFDGNGRPDILWTQVSTGRRLVWLMNGTTRLGNQTVELGTVATSWTISSR